MSAIASQIPGDESVCSIVCSDADQRKRQSSTSLAFVRGFPAQRANNAENVFIDDVIMSVVNSICNHQMILRGDIELGQLDSGNGLLPGEAIVTFYQ